MNALRGINPISPILADCDNWLFEGPKTDPFTTNSKAEAQKHAEDLNADGQDYAVICFNIAEGFVTDVTPDFWREKVDYDDFVPNHTAMMRRSGAFGRG